MILILLNQTSSKWIRIDFVDPKSILGCPNGHPNTPLVGLNMFLLLINIDYFDFGLYKTFALVLVSSFSLFLFLVPIVLNFGFYKYFRICICPYKY